MYIELHTSRRGRVVPSFRIGLCHLQYIQIYRGGEIHDLIGKGGFRTSAIILGALGMVLKFGPSAHPPSIGALPPTYACALRSPDTSCDGLFLGKTKGSGGKI